MIAAQNAVIAAEALGLGSCYIGDILENCEIHRELFDLPDYAFPIILLCIGHPTEQQKAREATERYAEEHVVFADRYQRLDGDAFERMFARQHERIFRGRADIQGCKNIGQAFYQRKFDSDFSREMSRSARKMLHTWLGAKRDSER